MLMNLTDKELIEYSKEHLYYEIWMLIEISKIKNISEQFFINITVESFAIHLRNLIIFLYPNKNSTKLTDVYAKDFFSDPQRWKTILPSLPQTLENARIRANKEVGHLTAERIAGTKDPKKSWKTKELTDEIIPILKLFCFEADKNKLDKSVSKLLS